MRVPTVTYEQSIVGAMLIDEQCIGRVMSEVSPADFSAPTYRGIFTVVKRLFSEGMPIDPVTVLHSGAGTFDVKLLSELMDITPTAANVQHYCQALKEANILNRLADLGANLCNDVANIEQARELAAQVNGLLAERQTAAISSAADLARDFMQIHSPNTPKPEYLPMCFKELEDVLRLTLGDFIILGGYPSAGKTLMCLQMALKLSEKYRVGFFSLETQRYKIADRLMAHISHVPLKKIQSHDLSATDWEALAAAASRLSTLQLDTIEAAGMSVADIEAMALANRYQVIIVDYLQIIHSTERDRYAAVTKISMQIHTMCQRHKIACIGLAQLSRSEKQKGKPVPPDMSSLRESGQLEQDADAVILLYTADPNNYRSNRVVKVAKNKDGERTKFELQFDGATQSLKSIPETPGQHFHRIQHEIKQAAKTKPDTPEWVQEAMAGNALPF